MPRSGLTREETLQKSIELVNGKGIGYLSVTTLSESLGIKKPSLYYHVKTVEEVIQWIMIYGWNYVSTEVVAQTGKMGIRQSEANHLLRTFRAFLEGFILLDVHNSFGNPISINESFEISMNVLIMGMYQYRGNK